MCCFNALITALVLGMSPNKKMVCLNSRSETPGKSSRRGSFSWDNRSTMVLLEVCAEFQSTHGKKQHFKWPRIQGKFEERTGKHVLVGQLRNKMEIIKRQYLLWTRLKNSMSGLEMDSVTGKIKADPDWWDMKIKENSEYKKFRDNGVVAEMDELWDRIFGDSCDTEEHCVVPLNSPSPNVSDGEQHLTPDGTVLEDFASPNNRIEVHGKKALTNTKVGRSGSFSWDKKNTMLLLEICADFQSTHGKKQHFKWPQIQEKFQECTGTHVLVGQLRNRMEIVKRQYLLWTRLKNSDIGLEVDPVTGKIEADPEWWDMKIKENSEYKKFRDNGVPPDMDKLSDIVFGDSCPTGAHYAVPEQQLSPNEPVTPTGECDPVLEDEEEHTDPSDFGNIHLIEGEGGSSSSLTRAVLKRRSTMTTGVPFSSPTETTTTPGGSKRLRLSPIVAAFQEAITELREEGRRAYDMVKAVCAPSPTLIFPSDPDQQLRDAYDVLYKMVAEGLLESGTELFCFAATKILDDTCRKGFMFLQSNADRLAWLEYQMKNK